MRPIPLLVLAALAAVLAGCGGSSHPSATTTSAAPAATSTAASGSGGSLVGAGSTLVQPLVSVWQKPVQTQLGIGLSYGGVGSGAGIQSITARTVSFGASDAPLTPDQASACKGCLQVPWALSATTLSYNLGGVGNDLRLSGPVIADIFLGKITSWSDPRIAGLNPGAKLPSRPITPVFRSDGSGDTYAFTDFLSRVSPTWKSKVGRSTQVAFPAGVGGKGNSGVAGVISRTDGAIGYISAAYALPNGLHVAAVQNAAGAFVAPSLASIAAAGATVGSVPANLEMHIVDPPASSRAAYPISTFTYAIVPTSTPSAAALKRFVDWAVTKGQAATYTKALVFAPLPAKVATADQAAMARVK